MIPFLIVLSVVVFVHEFGHYWVARRNGVRIEVFSIGFGPELFGRNDRHGTRWKFSAVPLGGYVKMLGDADATSATVDAARTRRTRTASPPRRVWQRMAIVVAGPVANFLFAIVVAGDPVRDGRAAVHPARGRRGAAGQPRGRGGPAARRPDHRGRRRSRSPASRSCRRSSATMPGQPLELHARRATARRSTCTVTPALQRDRGPLRQHASGRADRRQPRPASSIAAATRSWRCSRPTAETGKMIGGTLCGAGRDDHRQPRHRELGGPLRIAQMSGQIAQDGFVAGAVVHGRAVDQSRTDQPVPHPDAGRRSPR